mgnify:CR=1 FL=1
MEKAKVEKMFPLTQDMVVITFKVSVDLKKQIDDYCANHKINRSDFIRQCIIEYLKKEK